jgi:hypothetical protein
MKNFFLSLLILISFHSFGSANELFSKLMEVNAEWKNQPEQAVGLNTAQFNTPENFNGWIATHLMLVEQILRNRDVSFLTVSQQANRTHLLNELNGYWRAGVFPVNDYLAYKNPVFIDRIGTHCAVGYLMQQSGHDGLAQTINANEKFAYVHQIKTEGVTAWAYAHGFTVDELAWIQPGYPPTLPAEDMAGGVNGTVNVIVPDQTSQTVYVGGSFDHSIGGATCNNVALWVAGVAGWSWVGVGNGVNGEVHDMMLHNNKLYVGGNFTMAGSVAAKNVAVYDITLGQWQALGQLDSTVRAFAVYNNEVYAAGTFTGFLSKWNGSAWQDIANGFLYGQEARTLEVWNNELVIGGNFELATGALRRHVATYDGTYMGMSGMGTATPVNDLAPHAGKLYAAGDLYFMNDSAGLSYFDNDTWHIELKPSQQMMSSFGGVAIRKIFSNGQDLVAAGEFGCSGGMTYGNNLMLVQKQTFDTTVYTVLAPLLLTDGGVNDAVLSNNQLYFGGEFVTNMYNDTLNHVGYTEMLSTGIENDKGEVIKLSVFPNPSSDVVRIQTEGLSITKVELIDITGKRALVAAPNNSKHDISVSELAAGIYTVRVVTNNGVAVSRLVKN